MKQKKNIQSASSADARREPLLALANGCGNRDAPDVVVNKCAPAEGSGTRGNWKETVMTQTPMQRARPLRKPGLLTTESRDEFLRFRKAFYDEIQPSGPIETHYVDWIVTLAWEVRRYLRIKAELINGALFEALKNLLKQALSEDEFEFSYQRDKAAEKLATRWFVDDTAKAKVVARLAKLGLDEASVEGEAHRLRAAEIESADRLLTSKQQSLERALRFVGKLRKNLGDRLRQRSAKQLGENAPPLVTERVEQLGEDAPPLLIESAEQLDENAFPILVESVRINGK
jgi:hypothetical protein